MVIDDDDDKTYDDSEDSCGKDSDFLQEDQ
ncbi:MAG: hypothetical protein ACI90V_012916 [Bacillariaceae sp.]|jgi:hypothetical protein